MTPVNTPCPYVKGPQVVRIADVRPNPVSLRNVNTDSVGFRGLVQSIRNQGFTSAISVRPNQAKDDKGQPTGEWFLELMDGLHRYTAAKAAGLTEINAIVEDKDDGDVLKLQLMSNFHKIETTPAENAAQLRRIMDLDPMLTAAGLAESLGVSTKFIEDRLSLNKIKNAEIRKLIDDGSIKLVNAYALAKLPEDEQLEWVDKAMSLGWEEFVAEVTSRKKAINEARRKGEDASPTIWEPTPVQRKIGVIKEELGLSDNKANVAKAQNILIKPGMTAEEGFKMGLLWAVKLDPISVEEGRTKENQRIQEREETKKQREVAKAEKAQKTAARKHEEATLESEISTGILQGTMTDQSAKELRAELKEKWDAREAEAKAKEAPELVEAGV